MTDIKSTLFGNFTLDHPQTSEQTVNLAAGSTRNDPVISADAQARSECEVVDDSSEKLGTDPGRGHGESESDAPGVKRTRSDGGLPSTDSDIRPPALKKQKTSKSSKASSSVKSDKSISLPESNISAMPSSGPSCPTAGEEEAADDVGDDEDERGSDSGQLNDISKLREDYGWFSFQTGISINVHMGEEYLGDMCNYPAEVRETAVEILTQRLLTPEFLPMNVVEQEYDYHEVLKHESAPSVRAILANIFQLGDSGSRAQMIFQSKGTEKWTPLMVPFKSECEKSLGRSVRFVKPLDSNPVFEDDNLEVIEIPDAEAMSIPGPEDSLSPEEIQPSSSKTDFIMSQTFDSATSQHPLPLTAAVEVPDQGLLSTEQQNLSKPASASLASETGLQNQPKPLSSSVSTEFITVTAKSKSKKGVPVTLVSMGPPGSAPDLSSAAPPKPPVPVATLPANFKPSAPSSAQGDHLMTAIRELEYRLSRHGTLADPASYIGKGEHKYNIDEFIDDEELDEFEAASDVSAADVEDGQQKVEDEDEPEWKKTMRKIEHELETKRQLPESAKLALIQCLGEQSEEYARELEDEYSQSEDLFVLTNVDEYEGIEEAEDDSQASPIGERTRSEDKRVSVDYAIPVVPLHCVFNFQKSAKIKHLLDNPDLGPVAALFFSVLDAIVKRKGWNKVLSLVSRYGGSRKISAEIANLLINLRSYLLMETISSVTTILDAIARGGSPDSITANPDVALSTPVKSAGQNETNLEAEGNVDDQKLKRENVVLVACQLIRVDVKVVSMLAAKILRTRVAMRFFELQTSDIEEVESNFVKVVDPLVALPCATTKEIAEGEKTTAEPDGKNEISESQVKEMTPFQLKSQNSVRNVFNVFWNKQVIEHCIRVYFNGECAVAKMIHDAVDKIPVTRTILLELESLVSKISTRDAEMKNVRKKKLPSSKSTAKESVPSLEGLLETPVETESAVVIQPSTASPDEFLTATDNKPSSVPPLPMMEWLDFLAPMAMEFVRTFNCRKNILRRLMDEDSFEMVCKCQTQAFTSAQAIRSKLLNAKEVVQSKLPIKLFRRADAERCLSISWSSRFAALFVCILKETLESRPDVKDDIPEGLQNNWAAASTELARWFEERFKHWRKLTDQKNFYERRAPKTIPVRKDEIKKTKDGLASNKPSTDQKSKSVSKLNPPKLLLAESTTPTDPKSATSTPERQRTARRPIKDSRVGDAALAPQQDLDKTKPNGSGKKKSPSNKGSILPVPTATLKNADLPLVSPSNHNSDNGGGQIPAVVVILDGEDGTRPDDSLVQSPGKNAGSVDASSRQTGVQCFQPAINFETPKILRQVIPFITANNGTFNIDGYIYMYIYPGRTALIIFFWTVNPVQNFLVF